MSPIETLTVIVTVHIRTLPVMSVSIRPARVCVLQLVSTGTRINTRQADDLTAMQACNLQNLPENYTMRYCIHLILFHVIHILRGSLIRLIPCYDLAVPLLRCRRCQGAHRWLCTGKNVRVMFWSSLATSDGDAPGRKILHLEMNHMDT